MQTALLDVDYDKDLPAHIQLVPNEELMPAYEADYNEMKKSFIYGDTLNFRELMEKIKILQERYRIIETCSSATTWTAPLPYIPVHIVKTYGMPKSFLWVSQGFAKSFPGRNPACTLHAPYIISTRE